MYLDLGRWITGSAWCSSSPGCVSLHLKGTWETQNHQAFCVSLVLVSFTLIYRAACPLLVKHSTINLSLTSEESLTDSKLPDTGYLRTKGQESVYETCACVIHTILLSYMCINIVSSFHINVCAGYMCSSLGSIPKTLQHQMCQPTW